jgi:adenylate cyclase
VPRGQGSQSSEGQQTILCPGCGYAAAADFDYCPKCATRLLAPRPVSEERKTVATLICDLVGFTSMSEGADPDDVDALINDHSQGARRVIESHGGTVEKSIEESCRSVVCVGESRLES